MDPAGFISALGDESSKNQHQVVTEFVEDTAIHFIGCYGFLLIGLILQLSGSIQEQINCINSKSSVENAFSRDTTTFVNNFCWMAENDDSNTFVTFENPDLDARWYVDHLSKIFFLVAILFHVPKICWNMSVGGILNSYMGYTRLLLDIVKQKLESIPKDGIWGGTEKYHPARAFDPESKLFSQHQTYIPLRMDKFLKDVGEGDASLEDMLEGSTSSSIKNNETGCFDCRGSSKDTNRDAENPLMGESDESCCCLGNSCKNVCKMNDRALVGKLMYRNFSHMNVIPLIVSIHKVTYMQDSGTGHHEFLYDKKTGKPNSQIPIYRHGVLWCILKMWACEGNFNGSVLYKKYLYKTTFNFILSSSLLASSCFFGMKFLVGRDDIPEEMKCVISAQQIEATCILPTAGDVYIPIIIAIIFLAINTLLSFYVIVTVFIKPNTSSVGYNFLSYIFDDALGYSVLWQRPNTSELQKQMMKASVDAETPVIILPTEKKTQ